MFSKCFARLPRPFRYWPAARHVTQQSRAFQEPVRKKKNKTNPRAQRVDSIDNGLIIVNIGTDTRPNTKRDVYVGVLKVSKDCYISVLENFAERWLSVWPRRCAGGCWWVSLRANARSAVVSGLLGWRGADGGHTVSCGRKGSKSQFRIKNPG